MISRELSDSIQMKYDEISKVFGDFQKNSKLTCPPECGKCCFKPDVSCAPYELLPMAFYLLDQGRAEEMLELALSKKGEPCLFLKVFDKESGKARCSEYQYRPFICRAFGVSARHGKRGTEYSICRELKSKNTYTPEFSHEDEDLPYIEVWKKRLEVLDPKLLEIEIPINEALVVILEKVLLWENLRRATEPSPACKSVSNSDKGEN